VGRGCGGGRGKRGDARATKGKFFEGGGGGKGLNGKKKWGGGGGGGGRGTSGAGEWR